ncbi:MAG: DUF1015 domain-containing protein [Clostridia bacterium]|nr:DUF1015 domain-containing protein [Clostridia bacterium]
MAKIKAFRGYRYNPEKIDNTNLGVVMAPPYDTVSSSEQNNYYSSDEHNIIRISKGIKNDDDTEENNCYTRAADCLNKWTAEGVLKQEPESAIYLYEQRVKYNETTFVNHGIVALLELSELSDSEVVTCELPSISTTQDRYRLLSSIKANVDMINCMYIDPEKTLSSLILNLSATPPDVEFTTEEHVIESIGTHKLWVIKDEETINFVKSALKNKTFFITDGHNRYITALEYKNQCIEHDPNYTENSDCNYIMALCTNAFGNRMLQLPVHRMISNNKKFNEDFFVACAQDHFKVEKIIVDTANDNITETMKKQIATVRKETIFAVYCGGNYFYRLTLTDKDFIKTILPGKSSSYRSLDVVVLNKLIIEDILNIPEDKYDDYISYTKRTTKGVNAVKNKEVSCLFVLNPVKAEQIREVALSGDIMPDRAIYIFPKPATGVVVYKFDK